MLQDVIHPQEQLPAAIESISSPSMSDQILEFCDEGDLFPERSCGGGGGGSAAGAGSGGADICCYDDSNFPSDLDTSALSTLLDSELPSDPEADAVLAANYACSQLPPPRTAVFPVPGYLSNPQVDALDQVGFPDMAAIDGFPSFMSEPLVPLSAAPLQSTLSLPPVLDDECISTFSSYMGLEPSPSSTSCSFMDPTQLGGPFYPGTFGVSAPEEGLGFFPGSMAAGPDMRIQPPEVMLEYRRDNSGRGSCCGGVGIYGLENTTAHQRIYAGPGELQVLGDHQQLVNGCSSPTPLASDVPPLEESTFKVGRLSVEERKERIHRYMKKRNERNFSKKIKYACRKTLADSRPRVRGRFAKNDEFGEPNRPTSGNNEDEDEEEVGVKEEEDIIHSSDIYAHPWSPGYDNMREPITDCPYNFGTCIRQWR